MQAGDATASAKQRMAELASALSRRQSEHEEKQSKLDSEMAAARQPTLSAHQEQAAAVAHLQTEVDALRYTPCFQVLMWHPGY